MKKLFLFLIIILAFVSGTEAKHIIGGEATYVCTKTDVIAGGNASFDVKFIIYRDKIGGGAPFDDPATFGIYKSVNGNEWEMVDTLTENVSNIIDIEVTNDPCVVPPDNISAEKGEYNFSIVLPILQDQSYMITYQRCCRNNTINNIIRPDITGAAYLVEISPIAQRTGNSSPVFNDFPPMAICTGFEFTFDHSASDAEGDSLSYSYYNPLHAGGLRGSEDLPGSPWECDGVTPSAEFCPPPFLEVNFANPYDYYVPLGGAPVVNINRYTGQIKGVPNVLGQFIIGVQVKEYRNGQLIGSIFRDFQFNVIPCEPRIYAEIEHDKLLGEKKYLINSCGQNVVEFINLSQDRNYIYDHFWVFDINGQSDTIRDWNAVQVFPGIGTYTGKLYLNPGSICEDMADIFLNVYPEINADYEFSYDTCVAGPVQFEDKSVSGSGQIERWNWQLEEDHVSIIEDPIYTYSSPGNKLVTLTVEDKNECMDTITREVSYFPAPAIIVVEPSQFNGCVPATLGFQNLSVPIDTSYTTTWTFGDGGSSSDLHPVHTYNEAGIYDINIDVISPIGCTISRFFPNWITIKEGPVADFYYEPDNPSIINNNLDFFDESLDAIHWFWSFGDGEVSFERSPSHTFQDTGVHYVQLLVTHENHCVDTLIKVIDIEPIISYFMPNAFTPNGDGNNETFKGKGLFVEGMKSFSLRIWSRWGNLIFESTDPYTGWNGRKDNIGDLLPAGVYIYQLDYLDARGKRIIDKGFATLVR